MPETLSRPYAHGLARTGEAKLPCATRGSSHLSVETVQNRRTANLLWTHKRQLNLARQSRNGVAGTSQVT